MKVYLAHSGDINKHGHQDFDLIGVFQDKDTAIKAIEDSMKDVDMQYVKKDVKPSGNIFWEEHGMDIVTVGYLEVRDLL
jgi:hypothetical protein